MSKALGQKVDCSVCIAKAGHPCFMQPEYGESVYSQYVPGDAYWPERWHVGSRTQADTTVSDLASEGVADATDVSSPQYNDPVGNLEGQNGG